jgi:hypothetical protein
MLKITYRQFFSGRNDDFVIYLNAIKLCSSYISTGFFPVNDYLKRLSNLPAVLFITDSLLHFHNFFGSRFFFYLCKIIFQLKSSSILLVTIGENADPVKPVFFEKRFCHLNILAGFTRKPCNQCSA